MHENGLDDPNAILPSGTIASMSQQQHRGPASTPGMDALQARMFQVSGAGDRDSPIIGLGNRPQGLHKPFMLCIEAR